MPPTLLSQICDPMKIIGDSQQVRAPMSVCEFDNGVSGVRRAI